MSRGKITLKEVKIILQKLKLWALIAGILWIFYKFLLNEKKFAKVNSQTGFLGLESF